jgi:hypothetical protein
MKIYVRNVLLLSNHFQSLIDAGIIKIDPKQHHYQPLRVFISEYFDRLYRAENRCHRLAEKYCNGDITEKEYESRVKFTLNRLDFLNKDHVRVSGDPRGHALKISAEKSLVLINTAGYSFVRDWGENIILAPEF